MCRVEVERLIYWQLRRSQGEEARRVRYEVLVYSELTTTWSDGATDYK